MNNYPAWWNTTITLYNKFVDPKSKKSIWYEHIIPDCFYSKTQEEIIINNTKIVSDVSTCRLRVNDKFIPKDEWNELSPEDKYDFFTLCSGDIIVTKAIDFKIDEYVSGKRSSDLKNLYSDWPGSFVINSVRINVGGGRGNEHYHVKGL